MEHCLNLCLKKRPQNIPTNSPAVMYSRVLDPTIMISKTLQQRNTISNSVGTKKLKAMNMLKQRLYRYQSLSFFIVQTIHWQ